MPGDYTQSTSKALAGMQPYEPLGKALLFTSIS